MLEGDSSETIAGGQKRSQVGWFYGMLTFVALFYAEVSFLSKQGYVFK